MYCTAKFGDPAKSGVGAGSQKPSPAGQQTEARLQPEPASSAWETAPQALSGRVRTPRRLAISPFAPPACSLQLPKSNRQTLTNRFHIKPRAVSDLGFSNRQNPGGALHKLPGRTQARPYGFSAAFSTSCTPLEVICTPMHKSTNATTRRIPCAVWRDTRSVIFGAYA